MERALSSYKSSVSKKWLLFISGLVWLFACSIFVRQGIFYLIDYSHHILFNVFLGLASGIVFFFILFFGISRKHIQNIIKFDSEKHSIFHFADIKIYIIVAFLVISGLLLGKFHYVDMMSLHIFYICMGTVFFFVFLQFLFSLLFYKKINVSKTPVVN